MGPPCLVLLEDQLSTHKMPSECRVFLSEAKSVPQGRKQRPTPQDTCNIGKMRYFSAISFRICSPSSLHWSQDGSESSRYPTRACSSTLPEMTGEISPTGSTGNS